MQIAITRLQELPSADQERLASRINDYINKLESLREAIQNSYDSGEAKPFDVEEIKRQGREWLKAEKSRNASH